MSDTVDVAIIGAGPYGLSLAAHLRAADVDYRHFGIPMRLWEGTMPRGMFLKSQGFASNIADPDGTHTLEAFCQATGRPYASYGLPVSLDNFVSYGHWFQSERGLKIEETHVDDVTMRDGGFEVSAGGERLLARRVVVAIGVEAFAYVPRSLSGLSSAHCTHSAGHTDLAAFKGQDVIVVGAGQSALETAALLHENGASVQLVARKNELRWNGEPLPPTRPLLQRLKEPEAGLGSGLGTWFYSNHPDLFRRLPRNTRVTRARTALGPAGACWLRPRADQQFPVHLGHSVISAAMQDGRVRLTLSGPGGARQELAADHVIAATGYRTDLRRLPFLPEAIRSRVRIVAGSGSPDVGGDYQSSVPGLYFTGPAVAPTMGPVMRFVFGTWHAGPVTARNLAGAAGPEALTCRPSEPVVSRRRGLAPAKPAATPAASSARLRLGDVPMILMYHGVADEAEDPNHLCVAPSRFAEQMTWLKRRGLRGVGIGTLVDEMRAGRARGLVGITFDDGYVNVLEAALPELQRHGFTASMYIISDRLGGSNEWDEGPSWPLMSASQVGELAAAGMEIGSHGATHVRLAGLGAGQLDAEVGGSRASLGELAGAPIRGFAYPYGSMDAVARSAVRDAGYDYACAVQTPMSELGLMALPRVYVGQSDDARRMTAKRLLFRGYIAVKGRRP